ncbi:family 78 glycoside hydrolase catalytic domain [Paenibacillus sp.]|uniref:family 78 glycoside hydrolase catalytic domain n=1 Tax=Paenibacillus sp. TaxID=58172 RepID=UPI0028120491|nr:family 78 glycoside hydrolase catalytic domain [Paenibacillus sp.]
MEWNVGQGEARWIEKPAIDHRSWSRYTVEADVAVEAGGAAVLFGAKDDTAYYGCGLDLCGPGAAVTIYAVEGGGRAELGRATLPGEEASAVSRASLRIELGTGEVRVFANGRLALEAATPAFGSGTIGFATGAGQRAVFRDLRVLAEDGRAMYVNRFYDPTVVHFSAGRIEGASGLLLEGDAVALLETPAATDSPLFRKAFELPAGVPVASAVARVYAVGWYELRVNGRKADNRVLTPANTPYERRMLYDEYDVTDALRTGGNALGLWLGNGYNANYSRWGWKWRRNKAVVLQLDVELADGGKRRIVTDETWRTTDSPLLENDIYDGETYDGRLDRPGWDTYAYADDDWLPAAPAVPPEGTLEPNPQPPVRAFAALEPVRVLRPREGVAVYDFGQNVAGWARATVEGAVGSRLTLRYSELIDADGNLDPWTNRNAKATDAYILNGEGIETYEPRFTYHGFRYVEASGDARPIAVRAVPIRTDVRETGRFACSDALVNRIQSNLRWSFLNNLVTIPTDCCQRDERTPCLMDSAVVEEAAIQNFDMRHYYRKWLGDIEDSVTNPDWSGDKVTLPWHLYRYYGDKETLARQYPSMRGYVDHLARRWPEGIVTEGFGDWCAPNEDGWESYFREVEIVNTSLYYSQTSIVSEAAAVLGLPDEARRYAELADTIKRAFNEAFYKGDGRYGNGTQTALLMPLALGLTPEEAIAPTVRRLAEAIAAKDNRLDTGIYGTRYLLDVLADHGYVDLAYEVLTQESYPSFGFQIASGATTLWEQWSEKGGMHSHDHAMFGGIGVSYYTRLAGIRPLTPGYDTILIHPCIPSALDWAEASVDTPKGRISSAWRKEEGRLRLEVDIPEGTTAWIVLPSGATKRPEHERERVPAGPGKHTFEIE